MIPQRLCLRNFLCYRNPDPLDFTGIRLACISGNNGHGKSALLDAITWALWGKARAKMEDDLIHTGQVEMEVEFQFLLGQTSYRVIRKRSRARGGQTVLELQVHDGTSFRALSGNNVRETERKIMELLRMNYETFINSTFLLQGRADEFTIKPPAERKRILAEILGLSIYDKLEDLAKGKAREIETRVRELQVELRSIDQELAKRPEYEVALQEARDQVEDLCARLRRAEEELGLLRDKKALLEDKNRQVADLQISLEQGKRDLEDAQSNLAKARKRLEEYEAILAQAQEIEQGYAELEAARHQAEDYNQRLQILLHLKDERSRLEQAINAQEESLKAQRQLLAAQMAKLREKADQAGLTERRLADVRAKLDALRALSRQRESWREEQNALQAQIKSLQEANEQIRTQGETLKQKITQLADVSHCPLCQTPLSLETRENVRSQYQAEMDRLREAYRSNQAQIKQGEDRLNALRADLSQADAALQDLESWQRQEAILEQALAQSSQAAEELVALQKQLAELDDRLARQDFAREERIKLAGIYRQIEAQGYDQAAHNALQARIKTLTPFEERKSRLELARTNVEDERASVARYQSQVARYQESITRQRQQLEALMKELKGQEDVYRRLEEQQYVVADLQAKERDARMRLGAAQQRLEACRQLARTREERLAQEAQARQEQGIYEELAQAFSKKGIQAAIIEEVLPELEEEANRILARLSDNRLHVHFETQRETKKGDTIETLEIKIADELGTRSYENYSGGEQFRVNFAIRVALSKLLARRAGARLQTLVIDEGFGTQDAQGRERLVEAINSIRDDFEMILAITHIQELKDAFPVHVEVTKTESGSQIMIT